MFWKVKEKKMKEEKVPGLKELSDTGGGMEWKSGGFEVLLEEGGDRIMDLSVVEFEALE